MKNLPEKLYTAAQVREMDRLAIEEKGIAGFELMRRAGAAVFEKICNHWPEYNRITVFSGAGNNAGDGYVIATLALQAGYQVDVISLVNKQRLKGDASIALQGFLQAGGVITPYQKQDQLERAIVVDALLGTGLDREVSGDFSEAIHLINRSACPVIAVDLPSGLNADTGRVMGCTVKADKTVTFIGLKQGLFTGDAAEYCGKISYSSLNIPTEIFTEIKNSVRLIQDTPLPLRHRCAHKGHNGHVLLIGGDSGFSGAIRLAAEAALRSGAGLVSVATRAAHSHVLNLGRPEIMSHAVENKHALQVLLDKVNVAVIGPGLGQSTWAQEMFAEVLAANKNCIVDADALNLLAKNPAKRPDWVLTPHPGEAARLLSCSTADIACDRFATIRQLQKRYGGICLLKGAGSLIKGENESSLSTTGNPGMGSGGMGDVLAGMIGGLVAQGIGLESATQIAVYKHGQAADIVAAQGGERGLLASDLLPVIRQLLN